jgi:hypothetical protein
MALWGGVPGEGRNTDGMDDRPNFQLTGYRAITSEGRKRNKRVRLRSRLAGRPHLGHPIPLSRMPVNVTSSCNVQLARSMPTGTADMSHAVAT